MASILLVDDDAAIRDVLAARLVHAGYEVRHAASAEVALAIIRMSMPDALVLDLSMAPLGMTGLGLLTQLHATGELAKTRVIIFSAFASAVESAFAAKLGVAAIVEKGTMTGEQLVEKIRSLLDEPFVP